MKREYTTGSFDNVNFFTGDEVENTPVKGQRTLFVVGMHDLETICAHAQDIKHIYLGANQSFRFDLKTIVAWENLVVALLNKNYWVTLDVDITDYKSILDSLVSFSSFRRFILQLSVKIPYIEGLNLNTCIKIDDVDYDATNPGVWVHQLSSLLTPEKFTSWDNYTKDNAINE
jgi:hypothetical protein